LVGNIPENMKVKALNKDDFIKDLLPISFFII